jgi:hypothetical protein
LHKTKFYNYTLNDLLIYSFKEVSRLLTQEILDTVLKNSKDGSLYHEAICTMCYGVNREAHSPATSIALASINETDKLCYLQYFLADTMMDYFHDRIVYLTNDNSKFIQAAVRCMVLWKWNFCKRGCELIINSNGQDENDEDEDLAFLTSH